MSSVFDAKNKTHHTKAKMFLDSGGGPGVQRFDVVKYKKTVFTESSVKELEKRYL